MNLKILTRQPKPLPTREDLDKRNPKRVAVIAIVSTLTTLTWSILWWARNGSALLDELAFRAESLYLYWTLVATPLDRKVWLIIGAALLATIILVLFLVHRFVWRAFFPDLKRLDPRMHRGGRPEPLGRLYRAVPFRDGERTRYRLYFKDGGRLFPLFRFDHVDLDAPPEAGLFGETIIRCGRLERDPRASRFKNVAVDQPFPTHPLEDDFRPAEVNEDQKRKVNIVGPGPGTNPDVMRRKWQGEHSIAPPIEKRTLRPKTPPEPARESQ